MRLVLTGLLKGIVYINNSGTSTELKQQISEAVRSIGKETLATDEQNFLFQLQMVHTLKIYLCDYQFHKTSELKRHI
jgi:hypothetical protein